MIINISLQLKKIGFESDSHTGFKHAKLTNIK